MTKTLDLTIKLKVLKAIKREVHSLETLAKASGIGKGTLIPYVNTLIEEGKIEKKGATKAIPSVHYVEVEVPSRNFFEGWLDPSTGVRATRLG